MTNTNNENELTDTQRACLRLLRDELDAAVRSGDDARIAGASRATYDYLAILSPPKRES